MLLSFGIACLASIVVSAVSYEIGRRHGVQECSTLIASMRDQRNSALKSRDTISEARQEAIAVEIETHKKLLQLRQAVARSVVQLAEAAQIEVNTAAAVQTPESPKTESPQVEQVQESV